MQERAVRMQSTTDDVIVDWIRQATCEAAADRRQKKRYPFFRPATIAMGHGQGISLPAFTRDISPKGIGLLHSSPLENGQLTLIIPTSPDHQVEITTNITWCRPCGEGWYLSGGRFQGLSVSQVTSLLSMLLRAELDRRPKQRYPFFRPVVLKHCGDQTKRISAFSRDISTTGVGLIHNMPVETQQLTITVPRSNDNSFDINTQITWCKPCGEGWYLSGGWFRRILVEELPDRF